MSVNLLDLEWSFQPFFAWMRVLGINHLTEDWSAIKHAFNLILCYGLWAMFVACNLIQFVSFVLEEHGNSKSNTAFINLVIDYGNWVVHNIGVHSWIILFALRKKQWQHLHKSLMEMENYMEFYQQKISERRADFVKLRKLSLYALSFILLTVEIKKFVYSFDNLSCKDFFIQQEGFYSLIHSIALINNGTSIAQVLMELIADTEKVYGITVTFYFCINCWVISNNLKVITIEIKQAIEALSSGSICIDKLKLLQKHHFLVCGSVKLLNCAFGPALLMEFLFMVISLTNTIMDILLKSKESDYYSVTYRALLALTFSANLILTCHSAERICIEVSGRGINEIDPMKLIFIVS